MRYFEIYCIKINENTPKLPPIDVYVYCIIKFHLQNLAVLNYVN